MPFIQIEIIEGRTREKKVKMVKDVTDVVAEALECPKEAVKICIREMQPDHYAVAGTVWSDLENKPYKL